MDSRDHKFLQSGNDVLRVSPRLDEVELAAAREAGKLQKPTPISETYVGPLEFEPKRKHNAVDVGTIVCCSQHKERGRMEKCIKICQ